MISITGFTNSVIVHSINRRRKVRYPAYGLRFLLLRTSDPVWNARQLVAKNHLLCAEVGRVLLGLRLVIRMNCFFQSWICITCLFLYTGVIAHFPASSVNK